MAKSIESTKLFAQIFEQTADFVKITDRDGKLIFVNKALTDKTGYDESELIGKTPAVLKYEMRDADKAKHLWDTIMAGNVYKNCIRNRCKDGSTYYESITISPIFGEKGEIEHFVSTGKDVSDLVQLQNQLNELAMKDPLTGLCNRRSFNELLAAEKNRADRYGEMFGIIMLDIDHFKKVNDTYGHDTGDQTLVMLAEVIKNMVRENDTICRWGGEEFLLMAVNIDEAGLMLLAEKIREAVANIVFPTAGQLTISLGTTIYEPKEMLAKLLKRADKALYLAKDAGRNCIKMKKA